MAVSGFLSLPVAGQFYSHRVSFNYIIIAGFSIIPAPGAAGPARRASHRPCFTNHRHRPGPASSPSIAPLRPIAGFTSRHLQSPSPHHSGTLTWPGHRASPAHHCLLRLIWQSLRSRLFQLPFSTDFHSPIHHSTTRGLAFVIAWHRSGLQPPFHSTSTGLSGPDFAGRSAPAATLAPHATGA